MGNAAPGCYSLGYLICGVSCVVVCSGAMSMPRMMVDLPDDLSERIRRAPEEFGFSGRPSVSRVLRLLVERGARAIDEERREAVRRATYAAWADDPDPAKDAARNLARMREQGRL